MSDIRDILQIPKKTSLDNNQTVKQLPALKSSSRSSNREKKVRMKRELSMILKATFQTEESITLIPTISREKDLGLTTSKAKFSTQGVKKWIWTSFTNPARSDNLKLKHWCSKEDCKAVYPFARFNAKLTIPRFNSQEYGELLREKGWTEDETILLMNMCDRFSLRWAVIHDQWCCRAMFDQSLIDSGSMAKSLDDLRERYYYVINRLAETRGTTLAPFDSDHERRRREQATKLWNRTKEQVEEEKQLLMALEKIKSRRREREKKTRDLHKLVDERPPVPRRRSAIAINKAPESVVTPPALPVAKIKAPASSRTSLADKILAQKRKPAMQVLKFPEIRMDGVYLRSQRTRLVPLLGTKKTKAVEQGLSALNMECIPQVLDDNISDEFNELRAELVLLFELKSAALACKYEFEALKHQNVVNIKTEEKTEAPVPAPPPPPVLSVDEPKLPISDAIWVTFGFPGGRRKSEKSVLAVKVEGHGEEETEDEPIFDYYHLSGCFSSNFQMQRPGFHHTNVNMSKTYLESDNDQLVDQLKNKVSKLKTLTIDIGDEVRRQNKDLSNLDDHFEANRNVLESTMRRLGIISRSGSNRFLCYLILFAFTEKMNVFYAVHVPATDRRDESVQSDSFSDVSYLSGDWQGGVFVSLEDATKAVKTHCAQKARFKRFNHYEEACRFAEDGDTNLLTPTNASMPIGEESSVPFSRISSTELNALKRHIEKGEFDAFHKKVLSNPRYLINCSGDTPSILYHGCRYNAMHIAARVGCVRVCQFVLSLFEDANYLKRLFPDDLESTLENRRSFLFDLFLNMPDKVMNATPLHFASKYGHLEVVRVLISYEQCDRDALTVHGETAWQIACTGLKDENPQLREEICQMLVEKLYYVALYRQEHGLAILQSPMANVPLQRIVDETDPVGLAELKLTAAAGPMKHTDAEHIYQQWRNRPSAKGFSSPLEVLLQVRLRCIDSEKGMERIGRHLADTISVQWVEYWDFLKEYCDLRSEKGLTLLNDYLMTSTVGKLAVEEDFSFQSDLTSASIEYRDEKETQLVNFVCESFQSISMLNLDSEEEEYFTCDDSDEDEDDSAFYFADDAPAVGFIHGENPTKTDFDVYTAISECDISLDSFPAVMAWYRKVSKYTVEVMSHWPPFDSPRARMSFKHQQLLHGRLQPRELFSNC
ncbi:DNA methyltransferase 1-associated protein 1 [Trichinella nativa]|uniref:DNA methyltransferase 1-associated protein 1 n=1 Tax=Trichinella nativa TaxID=6335 RepID=A0A0V1LCP9_9BILA|nr:DNA methyltransferase 1-associated protein 1 [Trichinella nativa]